MEKLMNTAAAHHRREVSVSSLRATACPEFAGELAVETMSTSALVNNIRVEN